MVKDDWYDTEKEIYEEVVKSGGRGRIVFAAPQALNDAERQELRKLRNENALRRQQWAQSMQHDPTLGGILPKL
ncbi:TPA: hypothetical protein QCH65_000449 [Enterobacter roggenkampii]|nr:hypothetical protein [Enterobacter roggenkampii]